MSELSLEQIQKKTIKKLLTIHEDSEGGAIVLFKDGDSISVSVINLSHFEVASIINSVQNQMGVE